MKKKIAIICANGMGDLVLMSLLAFNGSLKNEVTIFHPFHDKYKNLLPNFSIQSIDSCKIEFFDLIFVQNDHSSIAYYFHDLKKIHSNIIFIFPKKSILSTDNDYIFNSELSFIDNLLILSDKFFGYKERSNGINQLNNPIRTNKRQVLIHPFSKNPIKNWPIKKFIQLYKELERENFYPLFLVTNEEFKKFDFTSYKTLISTSTEILLQTISKTDYFIGCDSGPGHIASSYNIPTLTISSDINLAKVWRPDYYINILAHPFFKLPRFCFSFWHLFLSVKKVKNLFLQLIEKEAKLC